MGRSGEEIFEWVLEKFEQQMGKEEFEQQMGKIEDDILVGLVERYMKAKLDIADANQQLQKWRERFDIAMADSGDVRREVAALLEMNETRLVGVPGGSIYVVERVSLDSATIKGPFSIPFNVNLVD